MPYPTTVASPRPHLWLDYAVPLRRASSASTLPQGVLEDLLAIADQDGRSLSNLIAYMVESRLEDYKKGRG